MLNKPIAVLISDVHYNLQTLKLADASMRQAIQKANDLYVPLIVAGDLHDTKANMRGECVNAMLDTFNLCTQPVYILRGNHDSINEKSEDSSLNFLEREDISDECNGVYTTPRIIINKLGFYNELGAINGNSVWLFAYHSSVDSLRAKIRTIDKGSCVIMHQGLQSSNMGDYIQDKSAITPQDVAGLRVISGHYHARQTIQLPDGGSWSYIGNPYTLSWGEANDPEKGFQILYSDGSLEFVPTNLRKHVIMEGDLISKNVKKSHKELTNKDLLWIKLHGRTDQLQSISKAAVYELIGVKQDFKLTLHPTDQGFSQFQQTKSLTQYELLDATIDRLGVTDETKTRLKQTWRDLL